MKQKKEYIKNIDYFKEKFFKLGFTLSNIFEDGGGKGAFPHGDVPPLLRHPH
ncbi:MAG: hypothetical protein H5U37_06465, partial [Caldisericia bacterium]|nr:hypothetical protein [Caldisericia bacterium]